ncbi:DNA topoisomerase-1 [Sporomusaceae bacterium BoRhaA]|uniref:type I DNA topoisomerase n=1 Tax=Pelorhabdus rhamnosifermentans TaxID=2772457 RepID=UPI0028B1C6B0|nr:type I DNA topoisomerase [Pelorhabdus rhamnosifermentans]MBU2702024.1 DNA topoisomerase-1 [Pelorhabdus rhamnosifermentans]
MKVLVVVESPAKAKTIEKFLGRNYTVRASMGHLRDLPKSQFGVDIEQNFAPKYINIRGKGDLIKALKEAAKNADKVYLATDPDREGEAIAWHLAYLLNIPVESACRIEFHEITKTAIQTAIKHPRPINFPQVDAQQTRRILDRIVGYKLSPLLWRKIRKGLSAGRVQSVAVRIICDREKEILDFVTEEYWTIAAKLRDHPKGSLFEAALNMIDGKKPAISDEVQAKKLTDDLRNLSYVVKDVKKKERRRNPAPPFTTSSLQQEAAKKLGFTSRKTMMVAQQLYEGLEIGSAGHVGLITYMRTDSTRIADSAQQEARDFVLEHYDETYLPAKAPVYAMKKSAQDAHEAVRPTGIIHTPEAVEKYLSRDQLKLYKLIWARFVASQMVAAVYDTLTVDITAGKFGLRATGSQLKFAGYLAVYTESKEDGKEKDSDKDVILPELTIGQNLSLDKILPKQHFTEPPPRYTEASLVKMLEEKGIGRPSTYAPIIETILARGYVERVEKKFQPTELGFVVLDLLKEYFDSIIDIPFTASLEDQLDSIAEGEAAKNDVLSEFYQPFAGKLAYADEQIGHVELPVEVSDIPCEKCGRMMVVKQGRYGKFLACPGFPECRNTKAIVKETGVECPLCGGKIVERKTKRGKVFYGCQNYPTCDFMTWDQPLNEKCPTCGALMVRHQFKKGFVVQCSSDTCPTRQHEKKSDAKEAATDKKKDSKKTAKAETKPKSIKKTAKKKAAAKKRVTKETAVKIAEESVRDVERGEQGD